MSNSFSHSKSRYVTKNQGDVVAQDYGLNSQQKSKSYFKSYSKSYSKSYGKSIKDTIIVSSHKNTTYNEDAKDNDPKNNDSKILLENKIDEDVCKDINEDINEDIDEDVIDIEDNIVEVFDGKTVPIKINKDDTFLQTDAVGYFADEPRHKFYVESLREVEHRLDTEIENEEDTNVNHNSNHNSNHKINSYLLSLENRYTDQTPHKISNSMYSIGLDLSVSSYKKSKITKKIEEALQIGIRELDYDNL